MNISIFNTRGGCGIVRGNQVAEFLGARLNPKSGYENDLCIYVKVKPQTYPKHSYYDFVDGAYNIDWLKAHPDIGVIAISPSSQKYLSKVLNRNDIVCIPHHHCNYERHLRPERPVKVVGIIGSKNSFQYPIEKIRDDLKDMGLTLLYEEDFWNTYAKSMNPRQAVKAFYEQIDIQIVWRPKPWSPRFDVYRNPLKLENASSFGIPTVAYPEPSYVREWDREFAHAESIPQLISLIRMLKEYPEVYKNMSKRALGKAELYHIDTIKKLYLAL